MNLPSNLKLSCTRKDNFLDWADSRRAARYRVWCKLPTDPDFAAVNTITESDSTLTDQPLGVAIAYRITAANESQPNPEITITLSRASPAQPRARKRPAFRGCGIDIFLRAP